MKQYVIAIYIRLSLEDSKYESLSIENQRLVLHEYIAGMPEGADAAVLEFFANTGDMCPCQQVKEFLSNEEFFGSELCKVPGLIESVTESLKAILDKGMRAVMEEKFGC